MTPSIVSFCRGLPLNLIIPCAEIKIVGSNFFGELKIDGNLVVKSKVPPRSESEPGDIYI